MPVCEKVLSCVTFGFPWVMWEVSGPRGREVPWYPSLLISSTWFIKIKLASVTCWSVMFSSRISFTLNLSGRSRLSWSSNFLINAGDDLNRLYLLSLSCLPPFCYFSFVNCIHIFSFSSSVSFYTPVSVPLLFLTTTSSPPILSISLPLFYFYPPFSFHPTFSISS